MTAQYAVDFGLRAAGLSQTPANTAFAWASLGGSFVGQPGCYQYGGNGFPPQSIPYASWIQLPPASCLSPTPASVQLATPHPASSIASAAFAQQLGIQPCEMVQFGWIADYGMRADVLPPRWTTHVDAASAKLYFADAVSRETTWEHPLLQCLRRVVEVARLYLWEPTETLFEEQKVLAWEHHRQCFESWHGPITDSEGRPYFVNSDLASSSWYDPREDTEYMYELESGLLTALSVQFPFHAASPPALTCVEPGRPCTMCSPRSPAFGSPCSNRSLMWKTEAGAEILFLEESSQLEGSAFGESPHNAALGTGNSEYLHTLLSMSSQADTLHALLTDDSELQRLKIAQRTDARRNARLEARQQTGFRLRKQTSDVETQTEAPNESTREESQEESYVGADLPLAKTRHGLNHDGITPNPPPMPALPAPVSLPRPAKLPPLPAAPKVSSCWASEPQKPLDLSIRAPPPLPALLASALRPYAKVTPSAFT